MNSKSALSLFSIMLLLASCGNPHLVKTESIDDQAGVSSMLQKDDAIEIKSDISGSGPAESQSSTTNVTNNTTNNTTVTISSADKNPNLDFGKLSVKIDINKLLTLTSTNSSPLSIEEVRIENKTHFDFRGGKFPGTDGDCIFGLDTKLQCKLDIEFIAQESGHFDDKVIIKFSNGEIVQIPLMGERVIVKEKENPGKLSLDQNSNNLVDFDVVQVGSNAKQNIVIRNPFDHAVKIESFKMFSEDESFKIVDTKYCEKQIGPGLCPIEIQYAPTKEGKSGATLIIQEENGKQLVVLLKGRATVPVIPTCPSNSKEIPNKALKKASALKLASTLPYKKSAKGTKAIVVNLWGTESNAKIRNSSTRIVKDAQIINVFKPLAVKENLEDILLNVNLIKVDSKEHNDTEIICLSSENFKKCSGRLFTGTSFTKLINPTFFMKGSNEPSNTVYENNLSARIEKCGDLNCERLQKKLSFKELFNLTEAEINQVKKEKSLTIVIADDTRQLSEPTLIFKTKDTSTCQKDSK